MDKTTAQRVVLETFKAPFDRKRYRDFVNELCNGFDETKAANMAVPDAFSEHVRNCQRLGSYLSPDNEAADILIVYLTEPMKLERTRTALRDFVAHKLKRGDGADNSYKEAALVAFVASDFPQSWRFSYIRMEYETRRDPKTGKIKPEERLTPARRFSYLVGADEECHTAQSRFMALLQNTERKPALADLEEAFSVESVTKEFFAQYAALFVTTQAALDRIVKKDPALRADFRAKGVSTVDFAKKLLGQIVFLYFIQKKGWLGVPRDGRWGDGPKNFMRQLADRAIKEKKALFNDVLEPLFYDTLATDRGHEAWCRDFNCRIPFLNGGLFEPISGYDWATSNISFENTLFTNREVADSGDTGTGILDVFDRFNFTVNEAEPLEKEVAIDPEMLGKVFENLIEDNRRKGLGAYYTPREIVHDMCQKSLINYLDTTLNARTAEIAREDIEMLILEGEQAAHYEGARKDGTVSYARKLPASVEGHARELDAALKDITVCDPAIGSGAFPVGMMTEIVRARVALTPYFNDISDRTPYHFKRHAIQHSIYGADIDSGAVEIAKLRLWLSLVVDEDDLRQIKPLPNLDYKVVVGDSLMGVELDFDSLGAFQRLEELKPVHFDETNPRKKQQMKREMDALISRITHDRQVFDFQIYFSEVFHRKKGFDVVIANPPYIGESGHKDLFRRTKDGHLGNYYMGKMDYFYFFFHLALNISGPRGEISFITTNYYLTAAGARKLRTDFKARAFIRQLINFNELRIFESALGQHNMVTMLRKSVAEGTANTCVTNRTGFASPQILGCILKWTDPHSQYYSVAQCDLYDGGENYIRLTREAAGRSNGKLSIHQILDKVKAQGELLGTIANINQGVVSGCDYVSGRNEDKLHGNTDVEPGDGIFVLDLDNPRDKQVAASFTDTEKRLLRKFYKNSDISRFACSTSSTKRLIYVGRDLDDLSDYPNVLAHLKRFRGILNQRREVENGVIKFFQLQWPRTEEIFTGDKIVIPYRSEENAFAYNNVEWFCRSDCYVVTQRYPNYDLKYLTALLNSRLYFQWLFHRGKRKGNVLEMMQVPLSEIPIKHIDKKDQKRFVDMTNQVTEAKRKDPAANTTRKEALIDEAVFDLYELSKEEREVVLASST